MSVTQVKETPVTDLERLKLIEQELQARLHQQAVIAELGQRALATQDLDTFLQDTSELVSQTLGVEYSKILEMLPGGEELVLVAGAGWREGAIGNVRFSAGKGSQAGYTIASNQPLIMEDVRTETRFAPPALLFEHEVTSAMTVIIPGKEGPFGVLAADSVEYRSFSENDISFLQNIANLLAVAVQNKRTQSQLNYQAYLLNNANDAIIAADLQGRITSWNKAAELIYGWKAEEVIGRHASEFIHTEFLQDYQDKILRQMAKTGRYQGEVQQYTRNGEAIFIEYKVRTLLNDTGEPVGYISVNRDITQRKKDEEEKRKQAAIKAALSELSELLFIAGLDQERVLDNIARRSADLIGDVCVVTLISEDGANVTPVAYHHQDPEAEDFLEELLSTTLYKREEGFVGQVIQSGQPLLVPVLSQDRVRNMIKAGYLPYLDRFGINSLLIVPLRARGEIIGTLGLTRDTPGQPYTEEDQSFLQDLADRAALAIANVRLVQDLRSELIERKRAEISLAEAQHLAHIGSWEWDATTDTVVLSDELLNIFGIERGANKPFLDVLLDRLHTEDQGAARAIIQRSFQDHLPFEFESRILRPDGATRVIHARGKVIVDKNGEVTRMRGTGLDITERKALEDALRESLGLFESLFEYAPDSTVLVDEQGRIVRINREAEITFGYSSEELQGQKVEVLIPGRIREQHEIHRKEYMQDPLPRTISLDTELIANRKNGEDFPVDISLSPVKTQQGMLVVAAVRDISEQKRMQSELNEIQRRLLESLEAERLYLSQELHDGPLQDLTVMSYQVFDMLEIAQNPTLIETMKEFRTDLKTMSDKLRAICYDLRPPALLDFGLHQAIQSYVENALQNREEPIAHLEIETENYHLPERAMLALFRISQHAVSNVLKHADAKNLNIRLQTDKDYLTLEIQDDGKGFELPRRWVELARQGHLGLAGTDERAKAIGGKMKVYSAPGKGTLIRVTLPIPGPQEVPGPLQVAQAR